MRERKRRWKWIIGLLVGAMIVGAYELSPRLLYENSPRHRADVIIILGGDAEGRVWRGSRKEEGRRKKWGRGGGFDLRGV
jgi:hypothetical protein